MKSTLPRYFEQQDFLFNTLEILVDRVTKNQADNLKAIEEFKDLLTTLDSDPLHPVFNNENLPNYIRQPDGSVMCGVDGSMQDIEGFDRVGFGVAFGAGSALNRGGTVEDIFPSPFIGEFYGANMGWKYHTTMDFTS